jgi:hypothetical protein
VPAPIGPLVGFALGVLLCWASLADTVSDDDARRGHALAFWFAALVYAPACGYFLAFAEDWSYAYLVDGRSIPSAVELVVVVADAASVVAGFAAAARGGRARSIRRTVGLAAVPLAASGLFVLGAYRRLRVDATFLRFQSDFGLQPVAGGRLGYALIWTWAMVALGFYLTYRGIRSTQPGPAGELGRLLK